MMLFSSTSGITPNPEICTGFYLRFGCTALAALIDGRVAIAIDLSPATFITKLLHSGGCGRVASGNLLRNLKQKLNQKWTGCTDHAADRCDGASDHCVTVYSYVFQCPVCLDQIALFDCLKHLRRCSAGKTKIIEFVYIANHMGLRKRLERSSMI